jgi:CelD/BcsL family acetyltransferase involved in cellulose biosynthesis
VSYRFDDVHDLDLMLAMINAEFGSESYFFDERFCNAFHAVAEWLQEHGELRITTILMDGQEAAVDLGAVHNGNYTVFCGGTSPKFPGIAKVMNFFHIQRACDTRLQSVDFLCGEFGWKNRIHLSPRPLYQFCTRAAAVAACVVAGPSCPAGSPTAAYAEKVEQFP